MQELFGRAVYLEGYLSCDFQFSFEGECLEIRGELQLVVSRHNICWQALKWLLLLGHIILQTQCQPWINHKEREALAEILAAFSYPNKIDQLHMRSMHVTGVCVCVVDDLLPHQVQRSDNVLCDYKTVPLEKTIPGYLSECPNKTVVVHSGPMISE